MNEPDFWLARSGAAYILHADPNGGWTHLWVESSGIISTGWTAGPPADLTTRFLGVSLPPRKGT